MRIFSALIGLCLSFSVFAATSPIMLKYQEGRDYTLLETPVPTLDPSKIEVVEAFSFTCPHCYKFEPSLEQWKKQQKPDIALVQTHMQWSGGMKPYQRGFYTSVFLKMQDKVMMPIFDAIHKENKYFENAEKWAEFFATQGVKKEIALATYNSANVTSLVDKADARIRAFKISSTPQLVVDGKYIIPTPDGISEADAHKRMLEVVDFLVTKIRAERAAKQ